MNPFKRAGESPGGPELALEASAGLKHASAELLERLIDDLTELVQTVEGKSSRRNFDSFVDALKRVDQVQLYEAPGRGPDPAQVDRELAALLGEVLE